MIVKELFAKLGLEVDNGVFSAADKALGNLKLGTLAVGGALAAVGGAMHSLMTTARDLADEAGKAAIRTGLNVQVWQELAGVATAAEVPIDAFEKALIKMSKAAFGASEGSEEMAKTFQALGVSTRGPAGELKDGEQLLLELADRFAEMPDGIRKTSLATQAFGRDGTRMLQMLNMGSAGISAMRAEVVELGIVIDQEGIEAANRWEEQQKRFNRVLLGLKTTIGTELIKAFLKMKDAIGGVTKVLGDFISTFLKAWKGIVIGLGAIALGFVVASAAALAHIGMLGFVIQTYLAMGAAALLAGAKTALGGLAAVAPWIGLAVAIAAALILLEDFIGFWQGKDSLFGELGEKWTKFLDSMLKDNAEDFWLLRALKAVGRFLTDIGGAFDSLAEKFMNSPIGKFAASVSDRLDEGQARAARGELTPYEKANGMFGYDPRAQFGGGASPETAAATSVSAGPRPVNTTFAPSVSVTANTGANPTDIAHAVRNELEDFHATKLREAKVK